MPASRAARFVFLVAPALVTASVSAQPWPTTLWSVQCKDVENVPQAECDDTHAASATGRMRTQLEEGSAWLQGLGFRVPSVMEADRTQAGARRYLAYGTTSTDLLGFYHKPSETLALRIRPVGDSTRVDSVAEAAAPVHELFHAVQASYAYPALDGWRWIDEGTAHAVELEWRRHRFNEASSSEIYRMDRTTRLYDHPLHQPRPVDASGELSDDQAYGTAHFWLGIGEMVRSAHRVQYLHNVLESLRAGDTQGLGGVDRALSAFDPEGLYSLYPRFVARYVTTPDLVEEEGFLDRTATLNRPVTQSFSVEPVAINFIHVYAEAPAGETATLTIEIVEDLEDLHLIVGSERQDTEESFGGVTSRNRFSTTVRGTGEPEEYIVRVANVARDAESSEERTYELRVGLMGACDGEEMMATIDPAWDRLDRVVSRQVRMIQPGIRRTLLPAEEYQREFEITETRPRGGLLRLEGGVDDEGVVCVDPIGTNIAVSLIENVIDEVPEDSLLARMERMGAAFGRRVASMSQEEFEAETDSSFSGLAQQMLQGRAGAGQFGMAMRFAEEHFRSEEGEPPMTMLKLFVPTAFGWQLDRVQGGLAVRHDSVGGWRSNTEAVVLIGIPDQSPEQLEAGVTYPARLLLTDDEGDGRALYHRWSGRTLDSGGSADHLDFQGTFTTLYPVRGEGTITFRRVGPVMEGTFEIEATVRREDVAQRFRRDINGEIVGDETGDRRSRTGPLLLTGEFQSAAAVEVDRPGRLIMRTARVSR